MKQRLEICHQVESTATGLPDTAQFQAWAEAALLPDVASAEITFRIVDTEEGQQLNRDYRGKDYATNVLTFTFDEDMPDVPGLPLLGDIVFCAQVVEKEAQEQNISLNDHYAHLTIHGVLHLQGYDHLEEDEALEMEALETRLLAGLGISDPYSEEK
ncbi:rRNA maturation RNase YbeY [Iodobacter fluviatilis]|uniref:Endoribonuclease YbeY n=1 Tax=Iodobacter fluviatilis TaxID=537 RepID=A0A377SSW3_9NEIS|nr:rRNA maturation RNase YbeY [Iodobacter fluviatilis]TCU82226.1 putative rRNA maturation factor [Iodobacter fluviatilis]STR45121.1 Probable rRNA maturation factor [Iodobacter fluviatilis]